MNATYSERLEAKKTAKWESSLAAIVPVYNEVNTLLSIVSQLSALAFISEIIVVDDGSHDGFGEIIDTLQKFPKLTLVQHPTNLGKGQAIRTGINIATSKYVVIQDADLEYMPADIGHLLEKMIEGSSDLVFGSRRLNDGILSYKNANPYYLCVSLLNLAVFVLYGYRLSDEATCYKMLPKATLEAMNLQCSRFEFCPEVVAKSARMGLSILEVPVSYQRRAAAQGKKIKLSDAFAAFKTLFLYRNWAPKKSTQTQKMVA